MGGSFLVAAFDWEGFGVESLGFPLMVFAWGLGRVAHSRSRLADQLRARTDELRAARDEGARMRVSADRGALSHELDTLLQRRLGELTRLADEGATVDDDVTASAVLADIERESRATLQEMRVIVGTLRSADGGPDRAPQPTLASLDALVYRAKGSDGRLRVEGDPRVLPAAVELSAYRTVEHLLDALRDSTGVEVIVRFGADSLELAVTGSPRRRGEAGAALARARERVELHGGTLRTSSGPGHAETVAELPLLVATA